MRMLVAGREAEHIPEGRRIPLLIAAMGCWEFLNRGNHRWCNGDDDDF